VPVVSTCADPTVAAGPAPGGPAPETSAVAEGWFAEATRPFTLVCLALTSAVALVDAVIGGRFILIGLLIIGPCMALATRRVRPTVILSLWAFGLAIVLGVPDGIWGSHLELDYAASVAVVGILTSSFAFLINRNPRYARTALGPRADDDPAEFVLMAYRGVIGRRPEPRGLDDQVRALRSGWSREQVLYGMVQSPEATMLALYRSGLRDLIDDFWSRRSQVDPALRPICFLHTMKTGGTTLASVLTELVAPWPCLTDLTLDQFICLPRALVSQAMLIAGHLPYEAVELLPDGIGLCAVVRDPVERTLSHHAHLNLILAGRDDRPVTIEEFVRAPHFHPLWHDYQARQLVHHAGVRDAWVTYSPSGAAAAIGLGGADAEYPLQSLFDSAPLEFAPDELRVAALERLETIEFVGTTDNLERLVGTIARYWRRQQPEGVPVMRPSEGRVTSEELPPALLDEIREATTADSALYERASVIAAAPPLAT
jgi:hypothetical protein